MEFDYSFYREPGDTSHNCLLFIDSLCARTDLKLSENGFLFCRLPKNAFRSVLEGFDSASRSTYTIGGIFAIVLYPSKLLFCSFSTRMSDHYALRKASSIILIPANIFKSWKSCPSFPAVIVNKLTIHQNLSIKSVTMHQ